jgi:hypothetical protein
MGTPEIPSLKDGEYLHFEYVQGQRDDEDGPVTYFSNMVDLANTREKAIRDVTELIANEDVWAIHVRRVEQPEQGVHLYDESQPLAVAQSEAHQYRTAYEELAQGFMKLEDAKTSMQAEYERQADHWQIGLRAQAAVIEMLKAKLVLIQGRAQRAQRDAYLMEPQDVFQDAKVDVQAELESAKRKAKAHQEDRKTQELAERTGLVRLTEDGTGLSEDRCVCGHPRHVHRKGDCEMCPSGKERSWRHEFNPEVN